MGELLGEKVWCEVRECENHIETLNYQGAKLEESIRKIQDKIKQFSAENSQFEEKSKEYQSLIQAKEAEAKGICPRLYAYMIRIAPIFAMFCSCRIQCKMYFIECGVEGRAEACARVRHSN